MSEETYEHGFHAGNVGDVWKHAILTALLHRLTQEVRPLHVIETHGGSGDYVLRPTGEWTEGIGKLWTSFPSGPEPLVRYLRIAPPPAAGAERFYPGSPSITAKLLRPTDRGTLCELVPRTCAALRESLASDSRLEVHEGDGIALLPDLLREVSADAQAVVVIDPPYSAKEEWQTIPTALLAAYAQAPTAVFFLWYPLKSYTRPNAMLQRLGRVALPAVTFELITTPLDLQKKRLNGSGVLLLNAPESVLWECGALGPPLGRACATHSGRYTTRSVGWSDVWTSQRV